MFGRHAMFAAVDLALIYTEKPRLFKDLLSCVVELVAQKKVATIRPIDVRPLGEIEAAYRSMQSGKHIDKILLKADSNAKVKINLFKLRVAQAGEKVATSRKNTAKCHQKPCKLFIDV